MSTANSTKSSPLQQAGRKLRARRQFRAFQRAYEQASPSMQAELLAMSQRHNPWH